MRAVSRNEKVAIEIQNRPAHGSMCLSRCQVTWRSDRNYWRENRELAEGWNFGPDAESSIDVEHVVKKLKECWDKVEYQFSASQLLSSSTSEPHEAGLLKLDCSKARSRLNWKPVWDINKTVSVTTQWYKEFYENDRIMSQSDLDEYIEDAKNKKLSGKLESRCKL